MNRSILRAISAAFLISCTLLARADATLADIKLSDPLPLGPQVKVGKLANGLSYYIQKNARPEKKLELRLVVKAGSILEDEDQQGLAHFTEHMAFNGSSHFKKSELISYLQSIGVKFGADLNAHTSFDETVYILPIPTDSKENVERGFLVLEDWAQGLSMRDADIDSERGVVLEELRLGKGAEDRMSKVLLPKLFNGSRYAQRLPIGKEAILKTFSYEAIKRFYTDWYRPDLMAVVVVGDIDPAEAEKMIQSHFGQLKNPPHERPRDYAAIGPRADSEGLVITDKEATSEVLYIRYPIQPLASTSTFADFRADLIENLYGSMLGARMQELTQQANPPFISGGSSMGRVVRGYKSYNSFALVGKAGVTAAVDALVEENGRARQFGFSASELERGKKDMLRSFERAYNEREKSDSAAYVGEYLRHFLEQEAIPGIANEYAYARQMLPRVTLAEVNQAFRKDNPERQKKLVVLMGSDHAGFPIPSREELLATLGHAESVPLKAQQEKPVAASLMNVFPKAGRIVAEKHDPQLGLTELTLSNGIKVVLKPTDFKNDQVLMGATRFGGQSLFGEQDTYSARYAGSIVGQMGVSDFSPLDLQKVMAGKTAHASASLGFLFDGIGGGSGSADIETMLQLLYLDLTQVRKDDAIYSAFISKQQDLARNALSRPESVFGDLLQSTLYDNHPRISRVARPGDFDRIKLDRVLEIYRDRFASSKGFVFFFVGSFDVEKIKPLLATYLGSLPTADTATAYHDVGIRPVKGVVKKAVYAGLEQKSDIAIVFSGAATYSEDEALRLQALTEVLNIKLIEVLREKMGLIYGGGMRASLEKNPYGNYTVNISLPCGPENVDKVIAATFAEIDKVKQQGPLAGDLDKVKENWSKTHRKSLQENAYWMGRLQFASLNGTDPASILTFERRSNAITPAELQAAARRYFTMDNYVQVVLYPAR